MLLSEQQTISKLGCIFFCHLGHTTLWTDIPGKDLLFVLRRKQIILARMHLTWCSLFDRNLGWVTCQAVLGEGALGEGGGRRGGGAACLFISPLLLFLFWLMRSRSHIWPLSCHGHFGMALSPRFSWFVGCFLQMWMVTLKLQSKNREGIWTKTVVFVLQIETPGRWGG